MTHMKLMCDSICIEKGPRRAMNAIRFTSFIHTSFSLEEEINGTFGIHKNKRIDNNDTRINVIGPLRFQIT